MPHPARRGWSTFQCSKWSTFQCSLTSEVIRRRGPWRGIEDVEFATLTWVAWYNSSRLLEPLGYVPPVEFEEAYYNRGVVPPENGFAGSTQSHDRVSP